REQLNWTDTFLVDQLRFLEGVGQVDVAGFSQRNLRIWFDQKKLRDYQLTINDVIEAVRSQHLESAAGQYVRVTVSFGFAGWEKRPTSTKWRTFKSFAGAGN